MSFSETAMTLTEDLLARASDDWLTAAEVIDVARRSGLQNPDDLRDLSVGLITRLIVTGFLIPGEYDGVGHRPWDCSAGEAVARIAEDWAARKDPFVMPGEIVWLDAPSK